MQGELNFHSGEDGYTQWVDLRRLTIEAAAARLNLPLGHAAEVWLRGGIRLRGRLRLDHELLFIEEDRVQHLTLEIQGVRFTYAEIDSCIRVD